jgi:hypothetical protein
MNTAWIEIFQPILYVARLVNGLAVLGTVTLTKEKQARMCIQA